jgi:hypothetical protein
MASSSWWYDRYDYDYRTTSYAAGSGSRSWMEKIGYGYDDSYWKPKSNKNETYQDILNQLQTSAAIINGESDQKTTVKWSSGEDRIEAGGTEPTIYLSPDKLLDDKDTIIENVLDGMTGKVYLASALQSSVHPTAYRQAMASRIAASPDTKRQKICDCGRHPKELKITFALCCGVGVDLTKPKATHRNAVMMWEAIETSIARQKVLSEWGGFGPYIAADSEMSSSTKAEVQAVIDASVAEGGTTTAEVASLGIAWNLLNTNDRVKLPEEYEECLDYAASQIDEEVSPEDRYKVCLDISHHLTTTLGTDKSGSEEPKPKVCDSGLLGDKVANGVDGALSAMASKDDGDPAASSVAAPDGLETSGLKYVMDKRTVTVSNKETYSKMVTELRSVITAVKNSLIFRNNDTTEPTFAHRTGDIDDNSLHKLAFKDDRIMMRREEINKKKIAICLLVDESGSMSEDLELPCGASSMRYEEARKVAITLTEALKSIDGISLSVYGHSTTNEGHREVVNMFEYVSPRQTDTSKLAQIASRNNNLDSYAMMHVADFVARDYADHERKIVFVISDGQPAGQGYGSTLAHNHMKSVCEHNLKRGVEIYGIGVAKAYNKALGDKMYGKGNNVILSDVVSSIGVITRFIRQVAKK